MRQRQLLLANGVTGRGTTGNASFSWGSAGGMDLRRWLKNKRTGLLFISATRSSKKPNPSVSIRGFPVYGSTGFIDEGKNARYIYSHVNYTL